MAPVDIPSRGRTPEGRGRLFDLDHAACPCLVWLCNEAISGKASFLAVALAASVALPLSCPAASRLADGPLDLSRLRNPVWVSVDHLRDPSVRKVPGGYRLLYSRLTPANANWGDPQNRAVASLFTRRFVRFGSDRDASPKGHASPGEVVKWHGRLILPYRTSSATPSRAIPGWSNGKSSPNRSLVGRLGAGAGRRGECHRLPHRRPLDDDLQRRPGRPAPRAGHLGRPARLEAGWAYPDGSATVDGPEIRRALRLAGGGQVAGDPDGPERHRQDDLRFCPARPMDSIGRCCRKRPDLFPHPTQVRTNRR
jgi:hypothetical protein